MARICFYFHLTDPCIVCHLKGRRQFAIRFGNLNHSPSSLICAHNTKQTEQHQENNERKIVYVKLNVAYQQIQSIFSRIENQMWVRQ